MNNARLRMIELSAQGYLCSQIVLMLGLNTAEEKNADLLRAIGGLADGCGEGSCTCGALTGGCCLLSLLINKQKSDNIDHPDYQNMIAELVHWFWIKYGFRYGGVDCMAIREANASEPMEKRCWIIIEDIYNKIGEILTAKGFNPNNRNYYSI
jgi:hypothetical protein